MKNNMTHSLVPTQKQSLPIDRNQNMNKHITAVIAESGAYHDLQIAPGTTPRDIRNQLSIDDHYLISKRGGEPFGDDENIYGSVAEGEKLFLATPVEVGVQGTSLLSQFLRFNRSSHARQVPELIVTRPIPRTTSTRARRQRSPMLVQRDSRPYWEQRGWTAQGNEFHGYYRTNAGSWRGKAKVSPSGRVELFMQHPPNALKESPHWPCFNWRLGGWYFIHTNAPIADLSSGILEVEKLLTGAHAQ
jgi:hypothetical protein